MKVVWDGSGSLVEEGVAQIPPDLLSPQLSRIAQFHRKPPVPAPSPPLLSFRPKGRFGGSHVFWEAFLMAPGSPRILRAGLAASCLQDRNHRCNGVEEGL